MDIFKSLGILVFMATSAITAFAETKLPDTYAFNRGVEAFQKGENQDALDWFNKEVSEHPDNGYAFIYISALRYGNDETGKAMTAINQAIKKLPKKDKEYTAVAYATRGGIYLALEDTIKALADYTQAIKADPSNPKMYNSRAQIYYEQKKYDLANADYRQMIILDEGDVMGYMGIGRNANDQKKWDEAIPQFNHVIKLAPDYSSGYSFRAEAYMGQEKWNEAIDDIVKALSIDFDRKAWYLATQIKDDQFPTLKAKIKVQSAKEPNEALWPYVLGSIYEDRGKYDEAVKVYHAANRIDANPIFYERIANCYFDTGEYQSALDAVERAIQMDSEYYDLVLLKGNILNEMGDYPNAIAELDKYVAQYPDNFFGYYRRGWFKDEAGDNDGAIDDYTMSIVLEPRYAYAYCGRGRFYHEQGKEDLARADFQKVIELDTVPDLGSSCAHYAYHFLGQRDKAMEFMNSLIDKNEDRAGTYYDAACLYSLMNEKEKAMEYLTKAFEQGYRRIAHTYADHDLDNIRELPEYKALIEQYSEPAQQEPVTVIEIVEDNAVQPVEIPFTKEGGVTKVRCTINELPLYFVFDTGAADVTMSMVEANFMLKNDYIKSSDVIGSARYIDANGDISEGTIINLRKVDFGGLELENVRASVVRNQKAPLLLGQSVLGRLGKIEIDNPNQKIKITCNK